MPKGGTREGAGRPSASPYSPLTDAPLSVRLGSLREGFDELRGERDAADAIREAVYNWIIKRLAQELTPGTIDTPPPAPVAGLRETGYHGLSTSGDT